MIKRLTLFVVIMTITLNGMGWGATGHRVVGKIATDHLHKKVRKKLDQLLQGKSLAEVSTWMDNIKSDDRYDHTHDWHWVTIPDGQQYSETEKNPKGDIIATMRRLIDELKAGNLDTKTEREHVMMLIHLVGDIHQPLHVGTGEDRGGNDVKVSWFWDDSNLHRVWDNGMIDGKLYSYTELAEVASNQSEEAIEDWADDGILVWADESIQLREAVYDLPEDNRIGFEYQYKNWDTVTLRLVQAGVRLAAVLNDIYG